MTVSLRGLSESGLETAGLDIIFLPKPVEPYEQDACGRWLMSRPDLVGQLLPGGLHKYHNNPSVLFYLVCREVVDRMCSKEDLSQITASMPLPMQRQIKREAYLAPEISSFSLCVGDFPHAAHGYIILEEGLMEQTLGAFELWRLQGVHQLAFLSYPYVVDIQTNDIKQSRRFPHMRLTHVLDVSAAATLLGLRAKLDEHALKTLRIAGLSHDRLMPAGGDLMKTISATAFDEDARYPELASQPKISAFLEKTGVSMQQLAPIIRGEGLLGTLLNMADKLSYVARDAEMFHLYCRSPGYSELEHSQITRLLQTNPSICAWWECVSVRNGRAFVDDAERFYQFLVLRVLLFRELHYASAARYAPMIVVRTMAMYLLATQAIKTEDLFKMTDEQLENIIQEVCQVQFLDQVTDCAVPECEAFSSHEAALAREKDLVASGIPFTFVEDLLAKIKLATNFLVRGPKGTIKRFDQAFPAETELLNALARVHEPFRLYYLPRVSMPSSVFRSILAFRRSQSEEWPQMTPPR